MSLTREQLAVTSPAELVATDQPRAYRVTVMRAGHWASKGLYCPPAVLAAAAPLFHGRPSFLNPPPPLPGGHGYPDLRDYIGILEDPRWDEQGGAITATLRLATTPAARVIGPLIENYLADRAAGHATPDIGLSAVIWVSARPARDAVAQHAARQIEQIHACDQVDAVYRPAAGGTFDGHGPVYGQQAAHPEPSSAALSPCAGEGCGPAAPARGVSAFNAFRIPAFDHGQPAQFSQETDLMDQNTYPPALTDATQPGPRQASAILAEQRRVLDELRDTLLDVRLAASNLPPHLQALARESLRASETRGLPWDAHDLDATIARIQAAWSADESRRTVRGAGPISMTDSLDQVTEAIAALIGSRAPRNGVRPLSGIREAYLLLSGDVEMRGVFNAERVQLANVNSTTMANIVANELNKAILAEFQSYPRWWTPIVRREQFNTLQTVRWIVLGGVGELPAVSEGAAYTELSWDDQGETTAWQKRGGYLGLTLEAMDKDDTSRLRAAPRALAQAAWLTLGKSVSAIFTASSGAGPTLADGGALFNSTAVTTPGGHANLGAAALDATSWAAAKLAMRKQVELNSGEQLGWLTSPRYLLVPPELENAALTLLASENMPGTANNDVNPEAQGNSHDARLDAARRRVIVVDLWTDPNNWAAVCDPQLYPTIGLGFRYGEVPELFSTASPNSGLMFTNDVMPIKARWFYAVGPIDYRGMYKANVA